MSLRKHLFILFIGFCIILLPFAGYWLLAEYTSQQLAPSSSDQLPPPKITDARFGIPINDIQGVVIEETQQHRDGYECGWLLQLTKNADAQSSLLAQEDHLLKRGYHLQPDESVRFASHDELFEYLRKNFLATTVSARLPIQPHLSMKQVKVCRYTRYDNQYHQVMVLFDPAKRIILVLLSDNQR